MLVSEVKHIFEPTSLECGQAVLSMLTNESIDTVRKTVGTNRETTLKQMFYALDEFGILYDKERKEVLKKSELPEICILSLETPKCWHWSLYFKGTFYDPEYGILDDFPPSKRRYYWKIKNN